MLNINLRLAAFSKYLFTALDALARRKSISLLAVFSLSFGGSWLFSLVRGIPIPSVCDEFSYLLAGDTFAHGRITNPTHPLWNYFDTFHILQQPSYMSMHPPGQGIFLALGQIVFHQPIFGVWLSVGLMCTAISWMLYAWVRPRWALVGGLVAVLQFGVFTYWSQSYWGGAVAGIGGALVFGALPRIFKSQRLCDVLLLGAGFAILVNTRPLEGIIFGIPLGCLVLPWRIKWHQVRKSRLIINVLLPLALFVLAIAASTGFYNKKITGHALEFPHVFYAKTYEQMPMFVWQPLYTVTDIHQRDWAGNFKKYHMKYYLRKRSLDGFAQYMSRDCGAMFMFYFGFPLALPSLVILLGLFFHRKRMWRYISALGLLLLMMAMLLIPANTYFFSSSICLVVLLITVGLRGVFLLRFHKILAGPALIVFLFGLQLFLNVTLTPAQASARSLARSFQTSSVSLPASFSREELKNILINRGGKYLVIVKYPSWHNYLWEWVYNDADIDHAPIVWARDIDGGSNEKLLDYFKDRQVLSIYVYWDMRSFPPFEARQ